MRFGRLWVAGLLLGGAGCSGFPTSNQPSIVVGLGADDPAAVAAASSVLEVVADPSVTLVDADGTPLAAGSLGDSDGAYLEDRLTDDADLELIIPVDLDAYEEGGSLPAVEVFQGSQTGLTFTFSAQGFAGGAQVVESSTTNAVGFPDSGVQEVVIPDVVVIDNSTPTPSPTPPEPTPTPGVTPVNQCTDDRDNDGDGWFDFADPDCDNGGTEETGLGDHVCNDGIDNDEDGYIDAFDIDCERGHGDSEESIDTPTQPPGACENGVDDDGDGWVDGDDPDCSVGDNERGFSTYLCNNSIDDDNDGSADADDSDCTSATVQEGDGPLLPTPTPAPTEPPTPTRVAVTPTAPGVTPGDGPPPPEFHTACEVQAIYDAYCTSCHGASEQEAGLDLQEAVAYDETVNQASTQLSGMDLIEPGDWENSYLLLKVLDFHGDVGGTGNVMPPPPLATLSTEDQLIIYGWVEFGAPEDCEATPPPTPTPSDPPPTPTLPDGGPCDDDLDNDGDGWADDDDPDCFFVGVEVGTSDFTCNDGFDNDDDGGADAADPECSNGYDDEGPPVTPTFAPGDTPTFAPGDTPTFPLGTPAQEGPCDDNEDNDGDGWADGDDPDCQNGSREVGPIDEGYACNDGQDNDGDFRIDVDDPDCETGTDQDEAGDATLPPTPTFFETFPPETLPQGGPCDDNVDNDGDGWVDEADPDCARVGLETSNTDPNYQCNDRLDNDGDTLVDAADPDCESGFDESEAGAATQPPPTAVPTPGPTDPQPTLPPDTNAPPTVNPTEPPTDAPPTEPPPTEPPNTDAPPTVNPTAPPTPTTAPTAVPTLPPTAVPTLLPPNCDDNVDNDGDGWKDGDDPDCFTGDTEVGFNTNYECNDGEDNDGDTKIDAADGDCTNGVDETEGPAPTPTGDLPTAPPGDVTCVDEQDNDGDGWIDDADPDCRVVGFEAGFDDSFECNDGVDNDDDGNTDSADPNCLAADDNDEGDAGGTPPSDGSCDDNVDNDGDDWIDEKDPDCGNLGREAAPTDSGYACNDGQDNDGDFLIDAEDPGCEDGLDQDETDPPDATLPPTEPPGEGTPRPAAPHTLCEVQTQVFDNYCATSGCHVAGGDYPNLTEGVSYGAIVGVPSVQAPDFDLINPGDEGRSYLFLKVVDAHIQAAGGSGLRMPPAPDPELSEDDVAILYGWIYYGAQEACD